MALPRYKPTPAESHTQYNREQFPFLIAPDDPSTRLGSLRHFLISPMIWKFFGILSLVTVAGVIWLYLDPMTANGQHGTPSLLVIVLSSILCILLVLRLLLGFIGNRSARRRRKVEENIPVYIPEIMPARDEVDIYTGGRAWVEWHCEQWHSVPQENIVIDYQALEAVSDDMVAPDMMIVTYELKEDPKAA